MKQLSLRTFGLLSLILALGCNKLLSSHRGGPAGSAATAESSADPATAADEKLSEKLEVYLTACLNGSARREFRHTADNYLGEVDEKKGPTESTVPYLHKVTMSGIEECEKAVTQAKGMQPALPELDTAVASFLAAMKAAAPTVNEAQVYYDQKNYKDDKMAKGQALHPQLFGHLKKVSDLSHAMSDAFAKVKDPLDKRDLERLKVKGPKVAYLTKRSVMNTDTFSKTINVDSVKDFFALPPADLQSKVDVLAQDLTELKQLVEAKGKELEGTSGVDRYASELSDYVKEAKEVTRRIRDKTKFTNTELQRLGTGAGWMTSASPDSLARHHESLISSYNSMRL